MTTQVDDILRRNSLSVTESRKKILSLFLNVHGALAHGDIERKAGEKTASGARTQSHAQP